MQITLQENEVEALIQALNWYIPQLREEIGGTEQYEMREELKVQEALLTGLLAKIGGSIADTNLSDIGADNPPWGG